MSLCALARAFYLLDKVAALDVVDDPRPEVVDALFIKHSDGLDGGPLDAKRSHGAVFRQFIAKCRFAHKPDGSG